MTRWIQLCLWKVIGNFKKGGRGVGEIQKPKFLKESIKVNRNFHCGGSGGWGGGESVNICCNNTISNRYTVPLRHIYNSNSKAIHCQQRCLNSDKQTISSYLFLFIIR